MDELVFKPMKRETPPGWLPTFVNKYYWKLLFVALVFIALAYRNFGGLLLLAIIYVFLRWMSTLHKAEKEAMRYVITDKSIRFTQDVSKVYRDTKYTPLETEWRIPYEDIREVELFSNGENGGPSTAALHDKYGSRLPEYKPVHLCYAGNGLPRSGKAVIVHTNRIYPSLAGKPVSYILTPENPEKFYSELRARVKGAEFRERRYEG